MAPPARPDDLEAELELIQLRRIADRTEQQVWTRTRELLAEGRLTGTSASRVLGVSVSTLWRHVKTL